MTAFSLLAAARLWYALPLIVVVSLVYAATRHEQMKPILWQSLRVARWVTGFMVVVFAILFLMSWIGGS